MVHYKKYLNSFKFLLLHLYWAFFVFYEAFKMCAQTARHPVKSRLQTAMNVFTALLGPHKIIHLSPGHLVHIFLMYLYKSKSLIVYLSTSLTVIKSIEGSKGLDQ